MIYNFRLTSIQMAGYRSSDDIAIIGLGCRFPGEAASPSAFFEMLVKGRDAWSEIPSERFNINAFYHPSASRKGSTVVRGGYFLNGDVALFDAPVSVNLQIFHKALVTEVVLYGESPLWMAI
jgi:hypothetical protein